MIKRSFFACWVIFHASLSSYFIGVGGDDNLKKLFGMGLWVLQVML